MVELLTHSVLVPVSPTFSTIGWLGVTVGMGATLDVAVAEVVDSREVGTSNEEVLKASTNSTTWLALSIFAVLMMVLFCLAVDEQNVWWR